MAEIAVILVVVVGMSCTSPCARVLKGGAGCIGDLSGADPAGVAVTRVEVPPSCPVEFQRATDFAACLTAALVSSLALYDAVG